jgi:hypothetical protein
MVFKRGDEDMRMADLAMRLGYELGSRVGEICFTEGAAQQLMAYNAGFFSSEAA